MGNIYKILENTNLHRKCTFDNAAKYTQHLSVLFVNSLGPVLPHNQQNQLVEKKKCTQKTRTAAISAIQRASSCTLLRD